MEWGLYGTWPIEWGGGAPDDRMIYESMRDGRGERFSKDDDADENCVLRSYARAIDQAKSYQQRGALQSFPAIATDTLPEWERILGAPNDPRASLTQRRGLLDAILAGNGAATYDNIVAALAKVLDGETVSLVTATKAALIPDVVDSIPTPLVTLNPGHGNFKPGLHTIGFAFETSTGHIRKLAATQTIAVGAGDSITINDYPLSLVTDAVRTHYYLSVSPGSSSLAFIATAVNLAVEITDYPRNPGTPGLYHIGVVVSPTTWASSSRRAGMHRVLGTMLSGATTYDFITESPFLLDSSPLGKAGF